jgi:hypothetical protein
MKHRPGTTLLEVLTAIFIMGIGLLALLTLFPLGALSMAQALNHDRAMATAIAVSENAIAMDLRHDTSVANQFNGGGVNPAPLKTNGPSWAVWVDPFGSQAGAGAIGKYGISPGIQRVSPSYVTNTATAARWFSLPDDILFFKNGTPDMSVADSGGTTLINRYGYYTAACLLICPNVSNPTVVDLYTVVYFKRNTALPANDEVAYSATGTAGTTSLSITYAAGQDKPALRKGTWLLDTSFHANYGVVEGGFYRVVSAADASATQVDVELESPLKNPINGANGGVVVVLSNAVEVFERRSAWKP